MATFNKSDSQVWNTTQSNYCLFFAGLPFFLGGIIVVLLAIGVILPNNNMPILFGLPFGGIFLAVGGALIF